MAEAKNGGPLAEGVTPVLARPLAPVALHGLSGEAIPSELDKSALVASALRAIDGVRQSPSHRCSQPAGFVMIGDRLSQVQVVVTSNPDAFMG